jgi:hypothetical protein
MEHSREIQWPGLASGWRTATDDDAADLYEALAAEAERSVRYNHFFTVLVLRCSTHDPQAVCDRVRCQLRRTDHVWLLAVGAAAQQEPPERAAPSGCLVAAALPETDEDAAEPAAERLRAALPDAADLSIGLAVFPGDGTDPGKLVARAVASAA